VPTWVLPVVRNLAAGMEMTVLLSVLSIGLGTVLGLVLGSIASMSGRLIRIAIRLYVDLWRGLPVIVTLFLIFFTLPAIGIRLPAALSAIIGLTLWMSANHAEIVRGAVQSLPTGQREAAFALGFTPTQGMRYVLLPQASRRMLPPYVSLMANLVQASALASIVGVLELTGSAQRQISRLTILGDSHALEIFGAVMVIYFLLCLPLTRLSAHLAQRIVG
jgi:polar amino acid transport system permease protein